MSRVCSTCKKEHPVERFGKKKTARDSLNSQCKGCAYESHRRYVRKDPARRAAQQKAARDARVARGGQRERDRENNLKYLYGLTEEEYARMSEEQGHVCKICRRPPRGTRPNTSRLVVDHCHDTGVIRGLLCHQCNWALGLLGDSADLLRAGVLYLESVA